MQTARMRIEKRNRCFMVLFAIVCSDNLIRRSGSGRKIAYVLFPRGANRTDRAAVNSSALHADKEAAVKPSVARQTRLRANTRIELHGKYLIKIPEADEKAGRFRTSNSDGEGDGEETWNGIRI